MAETPTTGDVKVILKLDTTEAKRKVGEVEHQIRTNERDRRLVVERVNKEGFGAKLGSGQTGKTIADKMLQKAIPKLGGFNPQLGGLARFAQGFAGGFRGGPNQPGGIQNLPGALGQAIGAAGNFVNPFPVGGISGSNVAGGAGSTLALAKTLYSTAERASKVAGLGIAYKMQSGQASVQTAAGKFFNELNSTFSYVNNFAGSYKDSFKRLADWDDTVAAVTGKLPDTQFYQPKFQRQALFERQFADMVTRNAALTKAGAMGASSVVDQIDDTFAQGMSR